MIAGVLTISATAFAELALTCNKIWHNKQGKWLTQGSARRRTFARCSTEPTGLKYAGSGKTQKLGLNF